MKKRFSEKQIIKILKEHEAGKRATEKCRIAKEIQQTYQLSERRACRLLDFVSDCTRSGNNIRVLTVIDEATRECLALEVDRFHDRQKGSCHTEPYCTDSWRAFPKRF